MSNYYQKTRKVSRRAYDSTLERLALSMALPHEFKPLRHPVVPVTLTAVMDGMTDDTFLITTVKKAFLCRDPCYPLWVERTMIAAGFCLQATGSAGSWNIPAAANKVLINPVWENVTGIAGAGAAADGTPVGNAYICDLGVVGDPGVNGTQSVFIPPNSTFCIRLFTGAAGGGTGIEFDFVYQFGGEEFTSTVTAASIADGFEYRGLAGTTTTFAGTLNEGTAPVGFTYLRSWRTTGTAPTANSSPLMQMGWLTAGLFAAPTGTATFFTPFAMPPEFNNSVIPYARTKLNSSAALFSNVSAVLNKEGTILAARLKASLVDPWLFTVNNINAVHPKMRYFDLLEKGLYTFTSPTGGPESFDDCVLTMPSNSAFNAAQRPLFGYKDIGIYNAVVFSDLANAVANTNLAISCFSHVEFETTSSLFAVGASNHALEDLHRAELALLKFGFFHENPVHLPALIAAAKAAIRLVAPLALPYLEQAGVALVKRGVQYARNYAGTPMTQQKQMVEPPRRKKVKTARKTMRRSRK